MTWRKATLGVLCILAATGAALAARGQLDPPAPPPLHPQPATWSAEDVTVAYLGHASVLIDFAGTRILTDPAFFARIGITIGGMTIGPKRVVEVALDPAELPPLDAVIVSHAHMDSLDRPSLARVASTPLLIVPARTRDLVDDLGFARVVELGWRQRTDIGAVHVEAIKVKHWGRRWPWGPWHGYNGYIFSRGDVSMLFASDTAYEPAIATLARERRISAAIIGNGAYDPWIRNHADPEQVWQMFVASGACYLVPVHWDTFRLGKEPLGDAITRLVAAAGPEASRVVIRRIGETWTMPNAPCTRP